MLTRHVSREIARYCDGQMTPDDARRVDAHLRSCARCRSEREQFELAARLMRGLAVVPAPASVWAGIAAELDAPRTRWHVLGRWRLAAVAAALAIALGVVAYWSTQSATGSWEVARAGADEPIRMAEGDWVDTQEGPAARITVGTIGTVDVERGTRVQLGELRADAYRLALARGTIHAQIAAPPRLFFVDTPAATLVDLGCAYTVTVDDTGAGELRVTEGWASLEVPGRESLVPAGARATVRTAEGPGTPYFEDAPAALRDALAAFDAGRDREDGLAVVLAEARVRDTLTLWHLLSRTEGEARARIFDRIAALARVPDDVTREQVLALDAVTLRRLREELAWTW